jgi:hypothetical protein
MHDEFGQLTCFPRFNIYIYLFAFLTTTQPALEAAAAEANAELRALTDQFESGL